jgi:p-hydroxybenzoate 3-monooxygenase
VTATSHAASQEQGQEQSQEQGLGQSQERTQIGIIGAGPAGLLLGHLLHRAGLDTVILESRAREHVAQRQRAGLLEQGTVEILRGCGAGARMDRLGLRHDGIELRFDGEPHRIDFAALTGRSVMIYAQTEIVNDLIALRAAPLLFQAEALGVDPANATIPYRHRGSTKVLRCDVVVACDGFHGVGRRSMPRLRVFDRDGPLAWLGILADVAPSAKELIYCQHENGFALHSMRSPQVSRLYLQVCPGDDTGAWPDDRIWDELATRFATGDGWQLGRGPVTEKAITPMRSFVAEPMRHDRLFLAGDAAHIVAPTGAKGLNLAVADVTLLARALVRWYRTGDDCLLGSYSDTALRRVWRAEQFSHYMTSLLHRFPGQDDFDFRLQQSLLRYTVSSPAAATALAENYTGLALDSLTGSQ